MVEALDIIEKIGCVLIFNTNFFPKKEGFLKLKNHGGHSSFVFPHLCSAKSKVCPPYNNYFPKKEGF